MRGSRIGSRFPSLHWTIRFILRIIRRQHRAIVSSFVVFVLSCGTLIWRQRHHRQLPRGPWGLPVVGILPHLLAVDNPGRKVRNQSLLYGPIFYTRLGRHRAVFLNSPELIQESIKCREDIFGITELEGQPVLDYINFTFDLPSPRLSPKNCEQTRMVYRVLHELTMENSSEGIEEKLTNQSAAILEAFKTSATNDTPVDPAVLLVFMIPNILFSIIFDFCSDTTKDPDYLGFLEGFCGIENHGSKSYISPQRDMLYSFVMNMSSGESITDWIHLADSVNKKLNMERDVISTAVEKFLTGLEKDNIDALDSPFTMNLLISFALIYVAEGSRHLAASLAWMFLFMVKYPHIQQNVQRELDEVVGRRRSPGLEDYPSLPYLRAVMQESSRFAPLALLSLQYKTESEISIGGYSIPRDTYVFHNIWALLHDCHTYPVPHKYNPDRFLQQLHNHRKFTEDERVRFLHFGKSIPREMVQLSIPEAIRYLIFSRVIHRFTMRSKLPDDELIVGGVTGSTNFPKPFEVTLNLRDQEMDNR